MKSAMKSLAQLVVCLWVAIVPLSAAATVLVGHFSGVVSWQWSDLPPTVHVGDPASGTFYVDIDYPYFAIEVGYTYAAYGYDVSATPGARPPFGLTIDLPGARYELALPRGELSMFHIPPPRLGRTDQRFYARVNAEPGDCCGGGIGLIAQPDSIYEVMDPRDLHPGPVDIYGVASFATYGQEVFDVRFQSLVWEKIPEPSGLLLFGTALGFAGWQRRRGRRG